MSEPSPNPDQTFNVTAIRIWSSMVTGGTMLEYFMKQVFFVDMELDDGSVCSMWDGLSYEDAIIAAGECAEGQYPVHDDVVVGPRH
ncbi:hypothetical protein [Methylobacterium sp. J-070]|uniref:hypothetical protein n=1 Tax=Methylobacterium sp. J-070 TaxID=2836650 RepID=UPI001FBA02F9|nr:hypothetical protein [Methylobacterium sp. J-070]MCJ2051262.1 hypothetical protein [Methylobacterium sp. J-070]